MQCTNAGIRIGLSGTPLEREDKRHLHIVGLFGEIIHRYTPKQAADDKITARATLKIVKSKVPIFYAEKYAELGNYPEWDKWAIANNRTRNLKIVDLISRTDTPFPKIVFVRTIYHQEVLKSQYGLGECPSLRYVNHKTPSEEIQDIKAGIEDGTVKVLISGPIFRQGVDMKRIATIINAAGGKATVDVIQKAGRGSRRLQDDGSHKENFLMIDFEDRGCDTPCPHKTCEWLRRHSKLRQTAYKKFGYTPQEFQ
jgi:superfamily II DNA or RNA helicase